MQFPNSNLSSERSLENWHHLHLPFSCTTVLQQWSASSSSWGLHLPYFSLDWSFVAALQRKKSCLAELVEGSAGAVPSLVLICGVEDDGLRSHACEMLH